MACNNCRDFGPNACTDITPTGCVSFQGTAQETLDICIGDNMTYVTNIILNKIKDLILGRGIILEDLTFEDCVYLEDILGNEEKNLINVLITYRAAICQLQAGLEATDATIAAFTDINLYTLGCLDPEDPCGDPLTFKGLIQAIITKLCALDSQFEGFAEGLLDSVEEIAGNFLIGGAITSCGGNGISTSGTGASAVVSIDALVPPNSPILYTGSQVGLFDGTGVGLPGTIMCGWYLCNGDNGTPDSADLPQNVAENLSYIIRFT